MTSDRLFVYGTLMRGFDHPMARLLSANADFLGEATCRGRLYLVRHYPGLMLSDDSADVVHGELFRLRARDELRLAAATEEVAAMVRALGDTPVEE